MLNPNIYNLFSLVLSIKGYEPEKISLIFEKGEKHTIQLQES